MAVRLFGVKMAGDRLATGTAMFSDRPDLEGEACARNWAPSETVPVGRAHGLLLGSDAPPFGIARLDNAGDHYPFSMEFFPTARGLEEYATAKALDAAGLRQNVSIGFSIEETGPVPDSLRKLGVRR